MGDSAIHETQPPTECLAAVDQLCDEYEAACRQGPPPPVAPYLDRIASPCRRWLAHHLLGAAADALGKPSRLVRRSLLEPLFDGARDDFEAAWKRFELAASNSSNVEQADGDSPHCPECSAILPRGAVDAGQSLCCPECGIPLVAAGPPVVDEKPGDVIGQYELVKWIGSGGFGDVWKARHAILQQFFALKIPRRHTAGRGARDMFRSEAQKVARLRHEDIVRVHAVLEHAGQTIIVTEFIDGQSLEQRLKREPYSVRDAVQMLARIARAVDYAHTCGIVHRDLKPANVLLNAQGEPRIIDFGLARFEAGDTAVSVAGQIKGTYRYMSPEQASGHGFEADRRSDIYTLGVMLFELLTGGVPFQNKSDIALLQMIVEKEPPSPRNFAATLPVDLETIVLTCLEKSPLRRYQSAQELAEELGRFLRREPILRRPISRVERGWRWCLRHRELAATGAALLVSLITGLALVTSQWRRAERALSARDASDVRGFLTASPLVAYQTLPAIKARMDRLAPVVAAQLARDNAPPSEQARARLLALDDDPAQWRPLCEYFLTADLADAWLFRDALVRTAEHDPNLAPAGMAIDAKSVDRDFRRFLLFAGTPIGAGQIDWAQQSEGACRQWLAIVDRDPKMFDILLDLLRERRALLIEPLCDHFSRQYEDPANQRLRVAATNVLRELSNDDDDLRLDLLLAAEPWQFQMLIANRERSWTRDQRRRLRRLARGEETALSTSKLSCAPAALQANASMLLVFCGDAGPGWAQLERSADLTVRSLMIDRASSCGVSARYVADALTRATTPGIQSGLLQCLGKMPPNTLTTAQLEQLKSRILQCYETAPDPEVRAAADSLLQRPDWLDNDTRDEVDRRLAAAGVSGAGVKNWYIEANDHAMSIQEPATFLMGNRDVKESGHIAFEHAHQRRIDRRFAIAMHETTLAQLRVQHSQWPSEEGTTDDECPASGVSWLVAADYCNWLTLQAGMQESDQCYVPAGKAGQLLREAENALERHGYRLPTEAEWEYASRAGTFTPLYFGAAPELLPQYECCLANSDFGRRRAVGQGLPNSAGLFDVMGNACEWCHDPFGEFPPASNDAWPDAGRPYRYFIDGQHMDRPPGWDDFFDRGSFVLRGHGAGDPHDYSQYFRDRAPGNQPGQPSIGFRVARTMPEVQSDDSAASANASAAD